MAEGNGRRRDRRATSLAAPEFFSPQVADARRMYLDLNPRRGRALAVVSAGVEQCTPDFEIRRQSFPYHCIEYVARGKGELMLAGERYPLEPGAVFAYRPGVAHVIKADPKAPFLKYFVDFSGTRAAALIADCGLGVGHAQVFPSDCLMPFYDELIRSGEAGGDALCVKLLECIALKIAAAFMPAEAARSRPFAAYLKVRALIEQHYLTLRSLEEVADQCGMDKAYVCRLFRRFDRQTPYRFLIMLKIKRAARELERPGALIKDVAAKVGFADPLHFSRLFHRVLGSWPSEFRRLR